MFRNVGLVLLIFLRDLPTLNKYAVYVPPHSTVVVVVVVVILVVVAVVVIDFVVVVSRNRLMIVHVIEEMAKV